MQKIIIAYIPVLHEGYRKFLDLNKDAKKLYIWGQDIINESDYLSKEIRALSPSLTKTSLESWGLSFPVEILTKDKISEVLDFNGQIVMPDDDISHIFSEKYLSGKNFVFANIFLRWERRNSVRENKIAQDQTITTDEFSKK